MTLNPAPAIRATNVFAANCPSRRVLDHVTSKWGVLVIVALADRLIPLVTWVGNNADEIVDAR
jgi:DNA-binding HxlR family transcriptional regulator